MTTESHVQILDQEYEGRDEASSSSSQNIHPLDLSAHGAPSFYQGNTEPHIISDVDTYTYTRGASWTLGHVI